jgi:hypothetical protein
MNYYEPATENHYTPHTQQPPHTYYRKHALNTGNKNAITEKRRDYRFRCDDYGKQSRITENSTGILKKKAG